MGFTQAAVGFAALSVVLIVGTESDATAELSAALAALLAGSVVMALWKPAMDNLQTLAGMKGTNQSVPGANGGMYGPGTPGGSGIGNSTQPW